MTPEPFSAFRRNLNPRLIVPILTVVSISTLVVTTYQVSFGTLIFSGELTPYLSQGIGFCLMGVVMIAAIEALLSGNPGMVAIPTVNSAVILAAVAAGIAEEMSGAPDQVFPTVTAAITIASLVTGGVFLALGWFKLGNLIRYIPYPVIGGFLAGTGWLVVSGALKTMNGVALSLANLGKFTEAGAWLRWLPGVIFGIVLLLLVRRYKHYLITPLMILGAIGLFYLILWLAGVSIQEARELGLLFAPFPAGGLWQPPPLAELASVDWGAILSVAGQIASLILISSITLLLYASGVEVTTGKEINLNQELRACGAGNLAAAFTASPPGYTIITMSVLSHRLGAFSRLVGLLIAAICAGILFFGGSLVALIPKSVLGGVLVYLGLTFLADWLVDGWRKLSRPDYLIVVVILLVMSGFGLLPGLGIGIVLAAGLFIWQYSRQPVIRHTLSGRALRSHVQRSQAQNELLLQEGRGLVVLELQGYIFFGTANQMYVQVRERLQSAKAQPEQAQSGQAIPPRVVLLDFLRVSGIDASAALSFLRLKRLLRQHHTLLVFTNLSPKIERQLQRDVLTPTDREAWSVFPDLDRGVEWFEEQVLAGEASLQLDVQAYPGAVQTGQKLGGLALLFARLGEETSSSAEAVDQALLQMMSYLERVELQAGQVLINQGERQQKLYMLDAGELSVEYRTEEDRQVRLETGGPGVIVGELSFYLGTPATATVIATQPSTAYSLSYEALSRLERENPLAAVVIHRFILKRVGLRLLSTLETVEALLD
jgi:SulP family sulfate permease